MSRKQTTPPAAPSLAQGAVCRAAGRDLGLVLGECRRIGQVMHLLKAAGRGARDAQDRSWFEHLDAVFEILYRDAGCAALTRAPGRGSTGSRLWPSSRACL